MNKTHFTRQELYDLVCKEPMTSLCKRYNISYYDFRKICKEMSIPLPKTGHWSKVQAGKLPEIEDLPEDYTGKQEVSLDIRKEREETSEAILSPIATLQKEIESDPTLPLVVPARLASPDPLITEAKNGLTRNQTRYGLFDGLISSNEGELDIRVSPGNVGASVTIYGCINKAIESQRL